MKEYIETLTLMQIHLTTRFPDFTFQESYQDCAFYFINGDNSLKINKSTLDKLLFADIADVLMCFCENNEQMAKNMIKTIRAKDSLLYQAVNNN